LYNILTEFGVTMKLVGIIKTVFKWNSYKVHNR
jgi:hypothetical protein